MIVKLIVVENFQFKGGFVEIFLNKSYVTVMLC